MLFFVSFDWRLNLVLKGLILKSTLLSHLLKDTQLVCCWLLQIFCVKILQKQPTENKNKLACFVRQWNTINEKLNALHMLLLLYEFFLCLFYFTREWTQTKRMKSWFNFAHPPTFTFLICSLEVSSHFGQLSIFFS